MTRATAAVPQSAWAAMAITSLVAILWGRGATSGLAPLIWVGLPLGILAVIRPRWGAVLTLLAVAVSPILAGTDAARALNYGPAILTLYGAVIGRLIRPRPDTRLPAELMWWFGAYITWALVCSAVSINPFAGFAYGFRYFLLLMILLVIWNEWSIRTFQGTVLAFAALLCGSAVASLIPMMQQGPMELILGQGWGPSRQTGIFQNSNVLGVFLAQAAMILLAFTLRLDCRSNREKLYAAVTCVGILSCALATFFTFSRGSFLCLAAGGLVLLANHRRLRLILGAVAGVGALAVFATPLGALLALVLRMGSGLSYRENLWSAGWRLMLDHPLTGVGPGKGMFEFYRPHYIETFATRGLLETQSGGAHNVFLTRGAEMGIPGLLLVAGIFIMIWMQVPGGIRRYREGDWLAGAAAAVIVGLSARAFFDDGVTLGSGHMEDALPFLVCTLILFLPRRAHQPGDRSSLRPTGQ